MNYNNPKVRVISTKEAKDINKNNVAYFTLTDGTVAVLKKDEQENTKNNQNIQKTPKSSIYQKYKMKNKINSENSNTSNNTSSNKKVEQNYLINKNNNIINKNNNNININNKISMNKKNNVNPNININIPPPKQNYENKNIIRRFNANNNSNNININNNENSKYQIIEAIPVKFCENPQIRNYSQPEPLYVQPYFNTEIVFSKIESNNNINSGYERNYGMNNNNMKYRFKKY